MNDLMIVAGPCSVDKDNIEDILAIADITVLSPEGVKKKAVMGTRVVGLKSRTDLAMSGEGMGIDFPIFMRNMDMLLSGKSGADMEQLPSILIAQEIIRKTKMLVATEIMSPLIQLPLFERIIPQGKLLIWNPAVNQLGWPMHKMGVFAKRNGWYVGLKNGKWLGGETGGATTMEKAWVGLSNYAALNEIEHRDRLVFIHRGVDIPEKGEYRSLPVHHVARRVKSVTGAKMFFDPSHTLGPKLRDNIVSAVIDAMKEKISDKEYLYDGILIEAGRSKTDTKQHITIQELNDLCQELSKWRNLVSP